MELLLTVADSLHDQVKLKFTTDIEERGLDVPQTENKFWNIMFENNLLFHQLVGNFEPIFLRDKVKYKTDRRYVLRNHKILNFGNSDYLLSILNYLGFKGEDIQVVFRSFLDSLKTEERDFQIAFLNQNNFNKKDRIPREDIDQLLEDKAKLLSRIYSPRLLKEKFWMFFYGYEKFKGIGQGSSTWPLVKLLFSFTEMTDIDIKVEIDNTFDDEHHDYVGKTDFMTSKEEVLVVNCRTYPDFFRQLNIKIHIGTGDGNIFLGQYMNYESEGRIISGNILLQRIIGKDVDLEPMVHHVPKLKDNEQMYQSDFDGINKSILQYLHDKKLNFRRTSLRAGHSFSTLEKWLNHHHSKS